MIAQRKMLLDAMIQECGHLFQVWTETHENGAWELHFHVEGPCCEAQVDEFLKGRWPNVNIKYGD